MNDEQLLRYSRQILLPEIDLDGQEKLLAAKVLIVGLGGLGSPVALYLAAAGVGELFLADFDRVDLTNLQRQIIHNTSRIDVLKSLSAELAIAALNPDIRVHCITQPLIDQRVMDSVAAVDVVLDCTDNFATRFALNAACVALKKPLVSGAAIRLEGQVTVFDARLSESPCYRCLFDDGDDDDTCTFSGVLAPVVGVIGSLQAQEAIKLLTGFGETLNGRMLTFDGKTSRFKEMVLRKDPACPVCAN